MSDDELRERFAAWAAPLRTASIPHLKAIRARGRRRVRRAVLAGVVALAVGCVSAGVVMARAPWLGHGQPPAGRHGLPAIPSAPPHWRPAGPPLAATAGLAAAPYEVALQDERLGVYRMRLDGGRPHRIAQLPSPSFPLTPGVDQYAGIAAAGDDRTFVLLVRHDAIGSDVSYDYYELQIADGGLAAPLSLPVHPPSTAMALSADARQLAVAEPGRGSRPGSITVFPLPSGASKSWTLPAGGAVTTALAWAGPHTLLALRLSASGPSADSGLYRLDTAAPGGGMVFAPMSTSAQMGGQIAVVAFSLRTGKPLALLTPAATRTGPDYFYCNVPWTDSSGQHLYVACGSNGFRIDRGLATPFRLSLRGFGGMWPAAW